MPSDDTWGGNYQVLLQGQNLDDDKDDADDASGDDKKEKAPDPYNGVRRLDQVNPPSTSVKDLDNYDGPKGPATVVVENYRGTTFEAALNAMRYADNNLAYDYSPRLEQIASNIVTAIDTFKRDLNNQDGMGGWKGDTHDAALDNVKQSFAEPEAMAKGAKAQSVLLDTFSKTVFQTKWYLTNNEGPYKDALAKYPNQADLVRWDYDYFAQNVLNNVYAPAVKDIAAKNPAFSAGQSQDVNDKGDTGGTGGAGDFGGGSGGAGDYSGGAGGAKGGAGDYPGGAGGATSGGADGSSSYPGTSPEFTPPGSTGAGDDSGGAGGYTGGAGDYTGGAGDFATSGADTPSFETPSYSPDPAIQGDSGDLVDPSTGSNFAADTGSGPSGVTSSPGYDPSAYRSALNSASPGSGMGDAAQSALRSGTEAAQQAANAAKTAGAGPGPGSGQLPKSAADFDPKTLSTASKGGGPAGDGHGGGGSGAGVGPRGGGSAAPPGTPVVAARGEGASAATPMAPSARMIDPSGAPAGGGGMPGGGGGPSGGQRGQTGKEHKESKALRSKTNGEVIVGDADAVIPVIGDSPNDTDRKSPTRTAEDR